MSIKISGSTFSDNGVGISVPAGTKVEIADSAFIRHGKAIDVRADAPSIMRKLGLPEDTSVKDLIEILHAIRSLERPSTEEAMRVARGSRLGSYFSAAANGASIGSFLLELSSGLS